MNVYFAYLVLDNALAEDFPYLINGDTEQYVTDTINISLYGYCTNKEDMQKFMECRNKDIFYVKRKRVKRSEYKKFKERLYLYEIIETYFDGTYTPTVVTRFEEMIAKDLSQYKPSIDYVIDKHRKNQNTQSPEYLRNREMIKIIDKVYGKYKTQFEIWVRYFSPTIDVVKLLKQVRGED